MRQCCLLALASTVVLLNTNIAVADTAVDAEPFSDATFILNVGRTGGWRFTVDAPLLLTHLGLYDWLADGFEGSYPIGVWDQGGTLLSSAIMPSGGDSELLNGFRYVSVAEADVIFSPGQTYTIGYFASAIFPSDHALHEPGWHAFNPLVHQVGTAVATNGSFPGLTMPTVQFTENWLGPSFQFMVVPGPASWLALGLLGLRGSRRRE